VGAIFQGNEFLFILAILLLILGPTKLPALARAFGQAVREFRKAASGYYDESPGAPGPAGSQEAGAPRREQQQ